MRTWPIALLMLGVSAAYWITRGITDYGDVYPLPGLALFAAIMGVLGLCIDPSRWLDRRLNRPPPPPYFMIDKVHGRYLELESDGSYESCQAFLAALGKNFKATYSVHLDAGPQLWNDKEHGYWNVRMFGQEFFVMRVRGDGMCVWGPKPPEDISGFLRVAEHFHAVEFRTWQTKVARCFGGSRSLRRGTAPRCG